MDNERIWTETVYLTERDISRILNIKQGAAVNLIMKNLPIASTGSKPGRHYRVSTQHFKDYLARILNGEPALYRNTKGD